MNPEPPASGQQLPQPQSRNGHGIQDRPGYQAEKGVRRPHGRGLVEGKAAGGGLGNAGRAQPRILLARLESQLEGAVGLVQLQCVVESVRPNEGSLTAAIFGKLLGEGHDGGALARLDQVGDGESLRQCRAAIHENDTLLLAQQTLFTRVAAADSLIGETNDGFPAHHFSCGRHSEQNPCFSLQFELDFHCLVGHHVGHAEVFCNLKQVVVVVAGQGRR